MDKFFLMSNAVAGARLALTDCYRQMGNLTEYVEFQNEHSDFGGDDEPVYEHLGALIERATSAVAVAGEMMGLSLLSQQVIAGADALKDSAITWYDFPIGPTHETVDFLESQLRILERIHEPKTQTVPARNVLNSIFQSLMTYCTKKCLRLSREKDVHNLINEILPLSFPDTLYEGSLAKPLKSYSPDFSIRSVETAIEVKFINDPKGVGPCIDAILADFEGYRDSEYRHFLCYIVQTGNYIAMPQLDAAFHDKGLSWSNRDFVLAIHESAGKLDGTKS